MGEVSPYAAFSIIAPYDLHGAMMENTPLPPLRGFTPQRPAYAMISTSISGFDLKQKFVIADGSIQNS